ncbi:MAG: hypothetical protein KGN74_03570 [Gemmatimonadota bacterium]|nr:hypothetical protein [Gemmatimonadota bacterium]MDE3172128.1 hypothetical protein [Gemmatimonadota bacterium]
MPLADRSPRLRAELERIAAERLAAQRAIERFYRREYLRVALQCLGWSLAGCFLLLVAFHMTDRPRAEAVFWSGMLIGYAGIWFTLILAYNRGSERGDW